MRSNKFKRLAFIVALWRHLHQHRRTVGYLVLFAKLFGKVFIKSQFSIGHYNAYYFLAVKIVSRNKVGHFSVNVFGIYPRYLFVHYKKLVVFGKRCVKHVVGVRVYGFAARLNGLAYFNGL